MNLSSVRHPLNFPWMFQSFGMKQSQEVDSQISSNSITTRVDEYRLDWFNWWFYHIFYHGIHHHQTTLWENISGTFFKHRTCKSKNNLFCFLKPRGFSGSLPTCWRLLTGSLEGTHFEVHQTLQRCMVILKGFLKQIVHCLGWFS